MSDEVTPLVPAQRVALALAAAERATAVLNLTASASSRRRVRGLLDQLWNSLTSDAIFDVDVAIRGIEALPEAREINPDRKAFLAMEALEAVVSAADELRPNRRAAGPYEDVMPGVMSAYDGIARTLESSRPRLIDPRNPPPPGAFEADEIRRQEADRVSLGADREIGQALPELRRRSQASAREIEGRIRPLIDRAYPSLGSRIASLFRVTFRDAD